MFYTQNRQMEGVEHIIGFIKAQQRERKKERDFLYIVLNKISVGFVFMSSIAVEEIVSN